MHILNYILAGCFLLLAQSCEDEILQTKQYPLLIRNTSMVDVFVYPTLVGASLSYPDTLLPESKFAGALVWNAESEGNLNLTRAWEEELAALPSDTLSIYFFDAGVYEDSAWSVIRDEYLILARYDLSIEDLQATDFVVTYP